MHTYTHAPLIADEGDVAASTYEEHESFWAMPRGTRSRVFYVLGWPIGAILHLTTPDSRQVALYRIA